MTLSSTPAAGGKPTVRIERGAKADLEIGAFADALADHWKRTAPGSQRRLMSLLLVRGGPSHVINLDKAKLHECVLTVCRSTAKLAV